MRVLRPALPCLACWLVCLATAHGQFSSIKPVFFPPTPPVSGAALVDPASSTVSINGRAFKTPEELAEHVGEFYYPALGTRLALDQLSASRRKTLDQYRQERDALTDELIVKLAEAEWEQAGPREQLLRALAARQTPRLAQLERNAEALRQDLVSGADWNSERAWHPGTGTLSPAHEANAEFQVLRAAVFYQGGLSTPQRWLLWEVAIERQEQRRPFPHPAPSGPRPMYFSPAAARLVLPDPLPASLETKLREFERIKFELKKTLTESLIAWDTHSARKRGAACAELAAAQAGDFAKLEQLADEIRQDLTTLPQARTPRLPPKLPADLAARRTAYLEKLKALREQQLALHRQRRQAAGARGTLRGEILDLREASEEFTAQHAEEIAALKRESQAIKAELENFAQANIDPETGERMDARALLAAHAVVDEFFARVGRAEIMYRHYDIAARWPGLSPEQRRLLFRAAVAYLAQQLPGPRLMPGGEKTPFPTW